MVSTRECEQRVGVLLEVLGLGRRLVAVGKRSGCAEAGIGSFRGFLSRYPGKHAGC